MIFSERLKTLRKEKKTDSKRVSRTDWNKAKFL